MRKTRLVIQPRRCLHTIGFLLLYMSCPVIGDWGLIQPDTALSHRAIALEREGARTLLKDPPTAARRNKTPDGFSACGLRDPWQREIEFDRRGNRDSCERRFRSSHVARTAWPEKTRNHFSLWRSTDSQRRITRKNDGRDDRRVTEISQKLERRQLDSSQMAGFADLRNFPPRYERSLRRDRDNGESKVHMWQDELTRRNSRRISTYRPGAEQTRKISIRSLVRREGQVRIFQAVQTETRAVLPQRVSRREDTEDSREQTTTRFQASKRESRREERNQALTERETVLVPTRRSFSLERRNILKNSRLSRSEENIRETRREDRSNQESRDRRTNVLAPTRRSLSLERRNMVENSRLSRPEALRETRREDRSNQESRDRRTPVLAPTRQSLSLKKRNILDNSRLSRFEPIRETQREDKSNLESRDRRTTVLATTRRSLSLERRNIVENSRLSRSEPIREIQLEDRSNQESRGRRTTEIAPTGRSLSLERQNIVENSRLSRSEPIRETRREDRSNQEPRDRRTTVLATMRRSLSLERRNIVENSQMSRSEPIRETPWEDRSNQESRGRRTTELVPTGRSPSLEMQNIVENSRLTRSQPIRETRRENRINQESRDRRTTVLAPTRRSLSLERRNTVGKSREDRSNQESVGRRTTQLAPMRRSRSLEGGIMLQNLLSSSDKAVRESRREIRSNWDWKEEKTARMHVRSEADKRELSRRLEINQRTTISGERKTRSQKGIPETSSRQPHNMLQMTGSSVGIRGAHRTSAIREYARSAQNEIKRLKEHQRRELPANSKDARLAERGDSSSLKEEIITGRLDSRRTENNRVLSRTEGKMYDNRDKFARSSRSPVNANGQRNTRQPATNPTNSLLIIKKTIHNVLNDNDVPWLKETATNCLIGAVVLYYTSRNAKFTY